jgi:hypothetical protein
MGPPGSNCAGATITSSRWLRQTPPLVTTHHLGRTTAAEWGSRLGGFPWWRPRQPSVESRGAAHGRRQEWRRLPEQWTVAAPGAIGAFCATGMYRSGPRAWEAIAITTGPGLGADRAARGVQVAFAWARETAAVKKRLGDRAIPGRQPRVYRFISPAMARFQSSPVRRGVLHDLESGGFSPPAHHSHVLAFQLNILVRTRTHIPAVDATLHSHSVNDHSQPASGRPLLIVVDHRRERNVYHHHRDRRLLAFTIAGALFVAALPVDAQTPADTTKVNKRDLAQGGPTADQQKETTADRQITQKIRRALMDNKTLST